MGYCMHQGDSKFRIAAHNHQQVLGALRALAEDAQRRHRRYAWVDTATLLKANSIKEFMREWRWDIALDAAGDLVHVGFSGEKLGDDQVLFNTLAPWVDAGSFIVMHGEDGATWRWYFDGTQCREQTATVSFGEVPSGDIIDVDAREVRDTPRLGQPPRRLT